MSVANERDRAMGTAQTHFIKALQQAEKISDNWYKSQSLAAVARFAPEAEIVRIADKSLAAAQLAGDAYRRVAVSSWAVRALAERGKVKQAETVIRSLLAESEKIEHPVCKTAALTILWQAVWVLPTAVRKPVQDALLAACAVANSWKSGSIMRFVALVVATEDRPQAQRIINSMRESIYKRQAQRKLDVGETETVRFFFPKV